MAGFVSKGNERANGFTDEDGVACFEVDTDEKDKYTIDWSDELGSSETISASSWVDEGPTTTAVALVGSDTSTSRWATGLGSMTNTVTTSDGRKFKTEIRLVSPGCGSTDY